MKEFVAEYGALILWLVLTVAATVIEASTCELVAIWFLPGTVTALILSFFTESFWVQVLVFVVLSSVCLTLAKTVFAKILPQNRIEPTNADALIGKNGIVEEEIDNLQSAGSVRIGGLTWSARTQGEEKIPAGTIVTVCSIAGVRLICKPADTEQE